MRAGVILMLILAIGCANGLKLIAHYPFGPPYDLVAKVISTLERDVK